MQRSRIVQGLTKKYVGQLRVQISSTGDDAHLLVDRMGREFGRGIEEYVCKYLGLKMEAHPWDTHQSAKKRI